MSDHYAKAIERVISGGSFTMEDSHDVRDLAQLGARVLEILRAHEARKAHYGKTSEPVMANGLSSILASARSLGLLESEAKP